MFRCNAICESIAHSLEESSGESESTSAPPDAILLFGRILADSESGLNEHSALLELVAQPKSRHKGPFQLLLVSLTLLFVSEKVVL